MIYNITGDLLKKDEIDIVCHQVNTKGIMGAGIALQIRQAYPKVYQTYKSYCEEYGSGLLGKILFVNCEDGKIIANIFGQDDIGRDSCKTYYTALEKALIKLEKIAKLTGKSVGFPYKMGCGLAGGDWLMVSEMIEEYFGNSEVDCYICHYNYGSRTMR
jgi:O-acetyl-ADP-ribose deacetylase (regulator of RNase III)